MSRPQPLDFYFDVYVRQIIEAAQKDSPTERVTILLGEFQNRCYLEGQHGLIDSLHNELDRHDSRVKQ